MKIFSRKALRISLLVLLVPVLIIGAWVVSVYSGLEKASDPVVRKADSATLRQLTRGAATGFSTPNGNHLWLGIPFAQSVSGEQRWTMPRAHIGWSGNREFISDPVPCFQFGQPFDKLPPEGHIGVEDCLSLDVIAPAMDAATAAAKKLPVMFWIHGGGNTIGAPRDLTKNKLVPGENVILVTTRYRLGPFGWFSHPALRDAGIPGSNFGTEDLITALQWVQDNISTFGGDPNNVTIFGQSAGGVNTFSLMLSPRAKGLFHRAILQSGGVLSVTQQQAENSVKQAVPGNDSNSEDIMAKLLVQQGKASDEAGAHEIARAMPPSEILAFLRSVPPLTLLKMYQRHEKDKMFSFPNVIQDDYTIPKAQPRDLVFDPERFNAVPTIFGANRDELKLLLLFDKNVTKRNFIGIPTVDDVDQFQRISSYLANAWQYAGVESPASWMRDAGYQDVFVYRFDWDEAPSYLGFDLGVLVGASHNMEIPFVMGQFDNREIPRFMLTKKNSDGRYALSSTMREYWAEFANNGNPGRGTSNRQALWAPWSTANDDANTMIFDTPADGGARMLRSTLSKASINAAVANDASLNDDQKCGIYKAFLLMKAWNQEDLARLNDGKCVD